MWHTTAGSPDYTFSSLSNLLKFIHSYNYNYNYSYSYKITTSSERKIYYVVLNIRGKTRG